MTDPPWQGNKGGRETVRRIFEKIARIRKEVVIGLIVAAIIGGIIYTRDSIWNWFATPPSTWNLGTSREWSIRPVVEMMAKSQLAEPCARSKPVQWFYREVFGEECIRLVVDPPKLAGMLSRRGPFKETGEPYRLLELFVEHHKGCLTLRRDGEKAVINEAQPSKIERKSGRLVCP